MDAPFNTPETDLPRRRGPVSLWIPLGVIAAVLSLAVIGASSVTDTRDFAHRHASVLPSQAL